MPPDARPERPGYLTVDALVGLAVTTVAVTAAVTLAATTIRNLNQARDRLTAMRIASDLYEDIYAGGRPDGRQVGETDGRSWTYTSESAATPEEPSLARRLHITVDRRFGPDLVLDAYVPPPPAADAAPATPSSN